MNKKLSLRRYEVLLLIKKLGEESSFGLAPVQKIKDVLTTEYTVKNGAVRKMISKLGKEGLIENPLRGCWRLTNKGEKILLKVKGGESDAN